MGYDVDYSKWSQFMDSDDEDEAPRVSTHEDHSDVKWKGKHYTQVERLNITDAMMESCRASYIETRHALGNQDNAPSPGKVRLPADYKKIMNEMSVAQLAK